jgi:hypothetical protein
MVSNAKSEDTFICHARPHRNCKVSLNFTMDIMKTPKCRFFFVIHRNKNKLFRDSGVATSNAPSSSGGGRAVCTSEGRPGSWRGALALLTDIGRAC